MCNQIVEENCGSLDYGRKEGRKEGSPVVSQIKEGDVFITRKDDLHRADIIFTHSIYLYEVSAGVTASQGQSADALYDEAKRNLDEFLQGLSIK
jgi:hypothetical protein